MLQNIKTELRIRNSAYDTEIQDLIDSAIADLKLCGIIDSKLATEGEIDVLIKRAVSLYCKANFGLNNEEFERYDKAYKALKIHLMLCKEYTSEMED